MSQDRAQRPGESGSALVEFIGAALLLLIPLMYLLLAVGRIQAAQFAVEAAASSAVRAVVTAPSSLEVEAWAYLAATVALADQGFDIEDVLPGGGLRIECSASPCLTPGAIVTASVRVSVPLPFIASLARNWLPLEVPVSAQARTHVDRYIEVR
ncbi:MAG: pilus assembly protein [Promicromonosporaceae bacterium]|nr:pilus assembly protein [Promicromonosporaceae bacterium]